MYGNNLRFHIECRAILEDGSANFGGALFFLAGHGVESVKKVAKERLVVVGIDHQGGGAFGHQWNAM